MTSRWGKAYALRAQRSWFLAASAHGQRCVLMKIIIFIRLLCFPQCGVRFSLYVVAPSLSFGAFLVLVSDLLEQRHKQATEIRNDAGFDNAYPSSSSLHQSVYVSVANFVAVAAACIALRQSVLAWQQTKQQ